MICKKTAALVLAAAMLFAAGCAPQVEDVVFEEVPVASELVIDNTDGEEHEVTELITAMPAEPAELNPLFASDEQILSLMCLVYEPAIKIDGTGRFQPSIIESWKIDNSGMQFTFTVRKDVYFHDGTEVTSDDLLATLSRIIQLDPKDCPYSRYKDIYGASRKVDEYTFTVTARQRTADIFYLMSFPVMPAESVGEMTANMLPAGTGPYKLESYDKDNGMMFVRCEKWWKVLPAIEKIHAKPIEEQEDRIHEYVEGNVNCIFTTLLTANSYRAEGNTNVYSAVTPYYDCLLPNMRHPVLSDVKVRQAISLAIDRRAIVADGVLGEGFATETALRPDMWFFEDGDSAVFAYDVEQANRLMDEAGYFYDEASGYRRNSAGEIVRFNLIYLKDDGIQQRKKVAEMIKVMLKDIGIQVNVVEKEQEEYGRLLGAKTFDMALVTYYTKANNDVSFMFGEEYNFSSYYGEELNTLLANARMAVYDEELIAANTKLNDYLAEYLPNIGLYFRDYAVVMDSGVKNVGKLHYLAIFQDIGEWD